MHFNHNKGQELIEHSLILAIIAVVSIAGLTMLGKNINNLFSGSKAKIDTKTPVSIFSKAIKNNSGSTDYGYPTIQIPDYILNNANSFARAYNPESLSVLGLMSNVPISPSNPFNTTSSYSIIAQSPKGEDDNNIDDNNVDNNDYNEDELYFGRQDFNSEQGEPYLIDHYYNENKIKPDELTPSNAAVLNDKILEEELALFDQQIKVLIKSPYKYSLYTQAELNQIKEAINFELQLLNSSVSPVVQLAGNGFAKEFYNQAITVIDNLIEHEGYRNGSNFGMYTVDNPGTSPYDIVYYNYYSGEKDDLQQQLITIQDQIAELQNQIDNYQEPETSQNSNIFNNIFNQQNNNQSESSTLDNLNSQLSEAEAEQDSIVTKLVNVEMELKKYGE
ncbi:MAG: hypothetical protein AB1782_09345 [Cyanobacteriota bacterium]